MLKLMAFFATLVANVAVAANEPAIKNKDADLEITVDPMVQWGGGGAIFPRFRQPRQCRGA